MRLQHLHCRLVVVFLEVYGQVTYPTCGVVDPIGIGWDLPHVDMYRTDV